MMGGIDYEGGNKKEFFIVESVFKVNSPTFRVMSHIVAGAIAQ